MQAPSPRKRFSIRNDTAPGEDGIVNRTGSDMDISVHGPQAAAAHLHVFPACPDRLSQRYESPPGGCCDPTCETLQLWSQTSLSGDIWLCHNVMAEGDSERGMHTKSLHSPPTHAHTPRTQHHRCCRLYPASRAACSLAANQLGPLRL